MDSCRRRFYDVATDTRLLWFWVNLYSRFLHYHCIWASYAFNGVGCHWYSFTCKFYALSDYVYSRSLTLQAHEIFGNMFFNAVFPSVLVWLFKLVTLCKPSDLFELQRFLTRSETVTASSRDPLPPPSFWVKGLDLVAQHPVTADFRNMLTFQVKPSSPLVDFQNRNIKPSGKASFVVSEDEPSWLTCRAINPNHICVIECLLQGIMVETWRREFWRCRMLG